MGIYCEPNETPTHHTQGPQRPQPGDTPPCMGLDKYFMRAQRDSNPSPHTAPVSALRACHEVLDTPLNALARHEVLDTPACMDLGMMVGMDMYARRGCYLGVPRARTLPNRNLRRERAWLSGSSRGRRRPLNRARHGPGFSHGAEVNAANPASLNLRFSTAPPGSHSKTTPKFTCASTTKPRGPKGFLKHFGGPQEPAKSAS